MSAPINGWTGNIGSEPDFREFPNGNDTPRRLVRLNVYFDNPVPNGQGGREDKGGFWMQVEWWHRDAEQFAKILQKGMRVTISGRLVKDTWKNKETQQEESALKIQATQVAVNLHRVESIELVARQQPAQRQPQRQSQPAPQQSQQPQQPQHQGQSQPQQQQQTAPDYDTFDDDVPF